MGINYLSMQPRTLFIKINLQGIMEGVGGADYVNRPSTFWLRVYILFIVQTFSLLFLLYTQRDIQMPSLKSSQTFGSLWLWLVLIAH